jgi:hypothetical protein
MSMSVMCYNGHKLTAKDEDFGTKAKCPVCGVIVPVPRPSRLAPLPPEPPSDVGDPPLVVSTGEPLAEEETPLTEYPGMAKVRQGLGYHYARVVVLLLTIFVLCVSYAFGTFAEIIPVLHEISGVGLLLTIILLYLQPLLGLVGSILCLAVPPQSGARGYIIASVVLDLAAIPIGAVITFSDIPTIAGAPLGFVAWVLFMLFLRHLANFLHRWVEESESREILFDGFLLLVPPLLVLLLSWVSLLTNLPRLYLIIAVALFFAWLVQGIKFLFALVDLIGGLRDAIQSRLPLKAP